MKYLKNINEGLTQTQAKELMTPLMDWQFIEDIKELSLEYLDEGYFLVIFLWYDLGIRPFYMLNYSHYTNKVDWECPFIEDVKNISELINPKDTIQYEFFFGKEDLPIKNKYKNKKFIDDIISRLEVMYDDYVYTPFETKIKQSCKIKRKRK